jgi:hypothetical protein
MDHDIDCPFLYTHPAKEEGFTMTTKSARKGAPEPSKIRTNRDWVMMVLGAFLTLLLLTLGYWSIGGPDSNPGPKMRGPVKHPKPTGMLPGRGVSSLCFHWTSDGSAEYSGEMKQSVSIAVSATAAAKRSASPVPGC